MPRRFLVPSILILLTLPLHGADVPLGELHSSPACEAWRSRVVSNGRTFYGAWTFAHFGFSEVTGSVAGGPIDGSGALMTSAEQTMASGPGWESVASDGTGYLAATNFDGALTAQLVDGSGLPQGDRISLETGSPSISIGGPTIDFSIGASWNGSHYVVVGAKATKNADQSIHKALLAFTIGANGKVAATRIIADDTSLLDLEPAGNGSLVLMLANGSVQSMLLDDSLATTTPVDVVTRGDIQADLASNGSGFLAVWAAGSVVEAIALDANGYPASAPFVVAQVPAEMAIYAVPAVTWDGSSYLIVWWANTLLGARSNGSGATPAFQISSRGTYPSLATNATGDTLVLFSAGCGTISSRVVRRGALASEPAERAVSLDAASQSSPHALRVGGATQIVWEESVATSTAIFGTFIDPNSNVRQVRQLTEDGSYSSGRAEVIPIANGSAVVWNEQSAGVTGSLRIERFDVLGNPFAAPVPIGTTQAFDLNSATNGSDVGVAFTQAGSVFASGNSYVAVVDTSGNVRQTLLSEAFSANSTIASLADRFLVVWRENTATARPLFSAVVDRGANVVSKQLILADSGVPYETALATNGEEALLVWSTVSNDGLTLMALRLDASGTARGTAVPLASSPSPFLNLRIAEDGDAYLVTYLTSDGGTAPWEVRRITVRGGAVSAPVTLISSNPAETILEYALSGSRVSGVVIARNIVDIGTKGAAQLYWRPIPLLHPRAAAR